MPLYQKLSLSEAFAKTEVLDVAPRRLLYGLKVGSLLTGFSKLNAVSPRMFCGRICDVSIVKRKYAVTPSMKIICEGMTHSDYFINWDGFDESGIGEGRALARSLEPLFLDDDSEIYDEVDQEVIFIGGDTISEPNWAHWFFEHLLKLESFSRAGVDMGLPIIISSRVPSRFLKWGDLLLGRKLNWKSTDLSRVCKLKTVWLTNCPAFRDKTMLPNIWADGFEKIRSLGRLASKSHLPRLANVPNVLFLSRQSAKWRRAANEEELLGLTKIHFPNTIVPDMSKLSVEDQIALWASADLVVCFAGADGPMANFLPVNSIVIECVAPNHVALFSSLIFTAINGIQTIRIKGSVLEGATQLGPNALDVDYIVSSEKYLKALTWAKEKGL